MKDQRKFISDESILSNEDFLSMAEDLNIEKFKNLISKHPNLIFKSDNKTGLTLLFNAVLHNNYPIVEYLLENAANPNIINCYGESILHHAVENGSHKIINLLLEKGADPNVQQESGETPMHIAASKGDYKVMKLLLLYNANAHLLTYEGLSPLDYAIERCDQKCIEVLSPEKKIKTDYRSSSEIGVKTAKNSESPLARWRKIVDLNSKLGNMHSNHTSKFSVNAKRKIDREDLVNLGHNYSTVSTSHKNNHDRVHSQKIQSLVFKKYGEDEDVNAYRSNSYHMRDIPDVLHSSEYDENSQFSKRQQDEPQTSRNNTENYFLRNDTEDAEQNFESPECPYMSENNFTEKRQIHPKIPGVLNYGNLINSHINRKKMLSNDNLQKESSNTKIHTEDNTNHLIPFSNETYGNNAQNSFDHSNTRITNSISKNYMNGFTLNNYVTKDNSTGGEEIFNLPLQRDALPKRRSNLGNSRCSESNEYDNYNSYLRNTESFQDKGKILAMFMSAKNNIVEIQKDAMKDTLNKCNTLRSSNVREFGDTSRRIDELFNFNCEEVNDFVNEEEIVPNELLEIQEDDTGSKEFAENNELNDMLISQGDDFCVTKSREKINVNQNASKVGNIKYFSQSNPINEFKQITIDTQNFDNEINTIIDPKSTRDFFPTEENSSSEVFIFLKSIGLECYTNSFLKHGFDDMQLIIDQMKSGEGITDQNLQEAGINRPGDRAKILIKLEEEAKLIDPQVQFENVYHKVEDSIDNIISDQYVKCIHSWLSHLKLEQYTVNFVNAGYHSMELLLVQMASKNPLTEKILEEEIKISKIGYRVRILNKLRDESKSYMNKLKSSGLEVEKGKDSAHPDSCRCRVF